MVPVQVITLDLPGFGNSKIPNGLASIGFYARAVLALLDHLDIQEAIVRPLQGRHHHPGAVSRSA